MQILKCKDYVEKRLSLLREKESAGELHVVQIGHDPASDRYVRNKLEDAEKIGLRAKLHIFEDSCNLHRYEVEKLIDELNYDDSVCGVIIQQPVPNNLYGVEMQVWPEKDVDGFTNESDFCPCTPEGIINYLKRDLKVDLVGKDVTVIGRGRLVGKPISEMLTKEDCTVTLCHSKTKKLSDKIKNADIIICATGQPKIFTSDYFSEDKLQIVIDAGISFDENGRICGDVDLNDCEKCGDNISITAVPGGVGLLTRLTLMEHCYD